MREQGGVAGDSGVVLNPDGGAKARRGVAQPTLQGDLLEAVVAPANMHAAWARVKSNKGAPGVDGMTIEEFPVFAKVHWPAIRQALIDGGYRPSPVRRVLIPKPGGGERALGIPTVVDRVIQQAIAQVLTPIFDPEFSELSFGFRPKRSAHGAVKQVQAYIKTGYRVAVDLDLQKFFDNVSHDILMARVARRVGDKRLLALIGRYLRAGVMIGECVQPSEIGTPQGGPLSPWTQKVTSSLNEKSHCVVLKRFLIYVARSNILMTNAPIYAFRKGSAFERCLRSDRPRLQPHRGRRGFGGAVRAIATPSISLPARGTEHQASGGSIRADDSDHDQGSRRGSGQAARLCTSQRTNDRGDGGARCVALSCQGKPAWLIAASEAINCIWSTFLTACWQRNWSRCMPYWSQTMRAV